MGLCGAVVGCAVVWVWVWMDGWVGGCFCVGLDWIGLDWIGGVSVGVGVGVRGGG